MNGNLIENLSLGILSFCLYAIGNTIKSIFREMHKLLKKIKFLKNYQSEPKEFVHDEFVILKGKANKIFSRLGNQTDKNIILSDSNSYYIEDFILKLENGSNFLIQPCITTRLHDVKTSYIRFEKSKLDILLNYLIFSKSPCIKQNDEIFLFGKVNKNKLDAVSIFHNMNNIKVKEINGFSFDRLIKKIKDKHLWKLHSSIFVLLSCSLAAIMIIRYQIYLRYKKYALTSKQRTRIYCKECESNICNVLCEKCKNLSEYCDICYLNLQDKIDNEEVELNTIKCLFCNKILDKCQKLLIN